MVIFFLNAGTFDFQKCQKRIKHQKGIFQITNFLPYLILGIFLWEFTHQSGIHATIAGVLLALTIPHDIKINKNSLLLKLEHTF